MEEMLILVDPEDRPAGEATKEEAHRKGLLHRAFSVFLHDGNGRMLIQRRARGKYHSAGLWANACCSHPRTGEELTQAVRRRLKEELGACCPVEEQFSFVYYHRFGETLYEYEYDHVFLGQYSGPLRPDPEEAEETRWVPFDELLEDLRLFPERYCVWFITAAPRILSALTEG
ncbi:MAG: isopentenyl-diphosphate Delta-isomerase [Oscillospiraceae bacterium]|nr:isopentenyl-diphosphate Delta-isomerase [Oscillospiraceae bacterium]MDY4191523.1 isopentenyl-diphosphate Delta-isomerase [Oscillospiraceae bacterium]